MAKANGRAKIGHNRGHGVLRLYRSYNMVDKDPAIDKLRTVVRDEGVSDSELATLSNVSVGTIKNWFGGKTKRPQHATLAAASNSLGWEWELKRARKIDIASELPKAVRWHERQKKLNG